MISHSKFVKQSLELNLFFLRIMKEHSIFLQASFAPKNIEYIQESEIFKNEFTALLAEAISLSNGIINADILDSGEIVTNFTAQAERATQYFTGISIDSNITSAELLLKGSKQKNNSSLLVNCVYSLNCRVIMAADMIAAFKAKLLNEVTTCKLFTQNFPLLIDHILREAIFFRNLLIRLQNGIEVDLNKEIIEQESFWNRIMAEHSKFIRGLLDPSEDALFDTANNFGKEFDTLTKEALELNNEISSIGSVTKDSLDATKEIIDFNTQGTKGILQCKVKSIILPLLADHVLRESNHYLRLLKTYTVLKS